MKRAVLTINTSHKPIKTPEFMSLQTLTTTGTSVSTPFVPRRPYWLTLHFYISSTVALIALLLTFSPFGLEAHSPSMAAEVPVVQKLRPHIDFLAAEYAILAQSHDDSIAIAVKVKADYLAADKTEMRLLKRGIKAFQLLIARSEDYHLHGRHVANMSARLLAWNAEIRARPKGSPVDEVENLRYSTALFEYMTATSTLVGMNANGQKVRQRSETLHNRVQDAKYWKAYYDEAGAQAYEAQNHWTGKATLFLARMDRFLYPPEKPRSSSTPSSLPSLAARTRRLNPAATKAVRAQTRLWLKDINERLCKVREDDDAKGVWARVRDQAVVKSEVEEALFGRWDDFEKASEIAAELDELDQTTAVLEELNVKHAEGDPELEKMSEIEKELLQVNHAHDLWKELEEKHAMRNPESCERK